MLTSVTTFTDPDETGSVTVIGLDDTDSRAAGMCTTYVAARIGARVRATGATVERLLLVRLNPAVEYKTRGNAALAVHTDLDPREAFSLARDVIDSLAETDDPATNPGLVVAQDEPGSAGDGSISEFARSAVREYLDRSTARDLIENHDYRHAGWGNGRGLIGALAAVGAWSGFASWSDFEGWTHEHIAYRESERWGTSRQVDHDSVFAAAKAGYPTAWDTVDRVEDEAVCVPHTPGPVLYGIRGDDRDACETVAARIESEPVVRAETFVTNQGTDIHLREGTIGTLRDGRAYRIEGIVAAPPETRRGGHVFVELADDGETLSCVAFEPTKRFRNRVRALRVGDRLTVCGEFTRRESGNSAIEGTLKLEKFAVRNLVNVEEVTPRCPECGRRMESAGRGQGYRCRDCGTNRDKKAERPVERDIEVGWHEVPPCARRHVAKPLVRGGFDAQTHPER